MSDGPRGAPPAGAAALYLITDGSEEGVARVAAALAAVPGGAIAVQLRNKTIALRALLARAYALRALTRRFDTALFINDRVDVALATQADGVHLPVRGLTAKVVRRVAPHLGIGVSTHSLAEVRMATLGGADLITFGPVWATPSKAGLGEPVGVAALAAAVRATPLPVFALGGVSAERAPACAQVGARIACIRAVLDDPAPGAAALALINAVTSVAPALATPPRNASLLDIR